MMASRSRTAEVAPPEENLSKIVPLPDASEYFTPDDDQLAIDLAEHWTDKVAFFHGEWRVYEHGVWGPRDPEEVEQNIREFLRPYRKRRVRVNQRQIASLAKMMRSTVYRPDRAVNLAQAEGRRYINMRNGLFDLETFELVDHRHDLLLTNQLDFDYDPEATCPEFENFLRSSLVLPGTTQTDHDMVALTEQALGYTMTARVDLKAAFWLRGVSNSGKSTLLWLIRDLMGGLATTIDLTQMGDNRFMLAETIGKHAVTFPEAEDSARLPDAIFKNLVGGQDEVWGDVKNSKAIKFIPTAKIWWAMNGSMRISDRSGATFNRIKLILFNRSFGEKERDLELPQKLHAERPGIFNTIMDQYRLLCRKGWRHVQQSENALKLYRSENDTEHTFIESRCEENDLATVRGSELYSAYKSWCEENGFKPKNSNQVAADWRRLGFKDKRSNGIVWEGVRLKTIRMRE
jgi:putative DNA primase/helicase